MTARFFILLFITLGISISGISQPFTESTKLLAKFPSLNQQFGESVEIHDNFAIVGAMKASKAHIFEKKDGEWKHKQILSSGFGGWFGQGVAIYDSVAVVGAPKESSNKGAVYVYRRNNYGWAMEQKLLPDDIQNGDAFGANVDIHKNVIVVGAPLDDDGDLDAGAIYIYEFDGTTWNEEAQLTGSNIDEGDGFGIGVGVWESYVVVGAHSCDYFESNAGSVHLFAKEAGIWVEKQMVGTSDAAGQDHFGYSVSIADGRFVAGAYGQNITGTNSGSAYVFKNTGTYWTEEAHISPSLSADHDWFGFDVSISENYLIMGSDIGPLEGSAVIFEYNGSEWVELQALMGSDTETGDSFGRSVGIYGNKVIVGALANGDEGVHTGSAYIFEKGVSGFVEQKDTEFSIFPNPSQGEVQINKDFKGSISLYTSQLRLVEVFDLNETDGRLNLHHLKPGLYFLGIQLEEGATFKRLILE